jgi:hypothetical protein
MKRLLFNATVVFLVVAAFPAAAQNWIFYVHDTPSSVSCGSAAGIPLAAATDCATAKKAAWDVLTKMLQIKGCLNPGCPVGSIIIPSEATCEYDPDHPWPRRFERKRWRVNWTWSCMSPPLACCKCLGEAMTSELSTGQAGLVDPLWTVDGVSAYATSPVPGWTGLLPPSRWIQPIASAKPEHASNNTLYKYELQFNVPRCTIPMDVELVGRFAADNSAIALLDGVQVAACSGPNCFSASHAFSAASIGPGVHTLAFHVTNIDFWSGLRVKAQLKAQCPKN